MELIISKSAYEETFPCICKSYVWNKYRLKNAHKKVFFLLMYKYMDKLGKGRAQRRSVPKNSI